MTTWVVKLGGSLLGSSELAHWLDIFAQFSDGRVVIVPGGGVFADAVRNAQKLSQINDNTAHQLAVRAMDQFGLLLQGINSSLVTANTELEIAERGWQHRAIVWLPSHMVLADETIPQSWHVTSDSLAAWLAAKVQAKHLLIVKSVSPSANIQDVSSLMQSGLVDMQFDAFITHQSFHTWIIGKAQFQAFEAGLTEETLQQEARYINNERL